MPKKTNKKEIEALKATLQELAKKVRWANDEHESPPEAEKPLEDDSGAKKANADPTMADKYRAAHFSVYDALPHWKRQVIDEKLYDDRIYKEFTKEVIANAESE